MNGISQKIYLELEPPTEEDCRSSQARILDGLKQQNITARLTLPVLRALYPLCENAGWKITISLAWNGWQWQGVGIEAGDTTNCHYGYAVDLGSTTVSVRLINCRTGEIILEESSYNRQIAYGADILTRIFYTKDNEESLNHVRKAALDTILSILETIHQQTGIAPKDCIQMVISGNTTMIHFLLGMDAFCVFASPYAVRAEQPGFLRGKDLGISVAGYVYCCPGKSNYLGGDIISGLLATKLYEEQEPCIFFDIGTNGELVIGNREFLLCGAGAAGPALEGEVVKTGMRAAAGAVDQVWLHKGSFFCHVIGDTKAQGICGSGIVDLIAELFVNGWINIKGQLQPEKSPLIKECQHELCVEYAPGLYFMQNDIDEFLKTKAAASTMVEIMLKETGLSLQDIGKFYAAGSFGKHISKESAVTIGLYPDIDRDKIINEGNSSLEGAHCLLLDRNLYSKIPEILENMVYIQFGAVDDFLMLMTAAQAIPHTDISRFPSVEKRLREHQINN